MGFNPLTLLILAAMAEVDPTMGDSKESKSRLEDIKYYTRSVGWR